MKRQRNTFDNLIARIKKNPVVSILIAAGTVIITLSTVTDASKNIISLITKSAIVDVTGMWVSQEMMNPFDENDKFRMHLQLQARDGAVYGTVRQVSSTNRYDFTTGILEGQKKGDIISFSLLERADTMEGIVTYKNYFHGNALKQQIEFTMSSDRPWGFPPQRFVVTRE